MHGLRHRAKLTNRKTWLIRQERGHERNLTTFNKLVLNIILMSKPKNNQGQVFNVAVLIRFFSGSVYFFFFWFPFWETETQNKCLITCYFYMNNSSRCVLPTNVWICALFRSCCELSSGSVVVGHASNCRGVYIIYILVLLFLAYWLYINAQISYCIISRNTIDWRRVDSFKHLTT